MEKLFAGLPADRPPAEAEGEVRAFWREASVFQKSLDRTRGGAPYVFYEGPPTANGLPHHGHVLTRVIKDLFPRYKTMCGFRVERKAGWDTHGLPVEIEVEKDLGLDGKADIERFGIQPFVDRCKESVWTYQSEWERLTEEVGFWIDMERPYVTYQKEYVESVWWAIQRLDELGLLYKGHKILPWCPRDMTGLSSHEVGQGYETVVDPAITVAFRLEGGEDASALAWTTTPWTLLSNVCLAVGPDVEYARVRREGRDYLLAASRVEAVLGEDAEVLRTMPGRDLVGRRYTPLFDLQGELDAPAHRIVAGDFVTTDEGTGIVHAAPAFGEDDYRVCRENGLAFVNLVEADGRFSAAAGPYAGQWVKDADEGIIEELEQRGQLVANDRYEHEYPHCWRCKTPLLYYARTAWYVETTRFKDRLVELNRSIGWIPEHIRDGRFGDFLANNKDWCLSRERYWGTPLPVWECQAEGCAGRRVLGSVAELQELAPEAPAELDPHRPGIDAVVVPCPECGGEARRVPEVIDCWFDSGAMPFAQWGYPHVDGSQALFEENFPADFICEAIDQTRGWFYTLHAIAALVFGGVAYENCLVLGHVLDAEGKKQSKKNKNYRPPREVIEEHGADAIRWFFCSRMTPGQGVRFSDEAVRDARRTYLLKLLNVYKFFQEYASSDGFDPRPGGTARPAPRERELLDRWILSFQSSATRRVRDALDRLDFNRAAGELEAFVDGLSNWYVRRSRDRGWSKPGPESHSKWAFWWTLYEVLGGMARLTAPFTPFVADELHRVLERQVLPDAAESVHLTEYPVPEAASEDAALEARMARARRAVNLGLAVRSSKDVKIKIRQPLPRAVVLLSTVAEEGDVHALAPVIADELNVKAVEVSREHDRFVEFAVKPDFRRLGPRFGRRMKAVQAALGGLDARDVAARVRGGQAVAVEVEGREELLAPDELDVRLAARSGYAAAEEGGMVVVLDTQVTPELRREGLAREVQNRVQAARKEADLPFDARIEVWLAGAGDELRAAVEEHRDAIARETQADALHLDPAPSGVAAAPTKVEGEEVALSIRTLAGAS